MDDGFTAFVEARGQSLLRFAWLLTADADSAQAALVEQERPAPVALVLAGLGGEDPDGLEVIAGLASSVMANYAGNIAPPALEDRFAAWAWSPPIG